MTFFEWWTTVEHPDVLHMHDAQAGWNAAMLHAFGPEVAQDVMQEPSPEGPFRRIANWLRG